MNNVSLIGRLTRDVEVRYTQTTNKMVANFNLAVDKRNKETNFFNCEAWGKTAELLEKYTKKGQQIGILGELDNDVYEKDGKTITRTKVIVREITLIGKREEPDIYGDVALEQDAPETYDDDLPF